MLFFSLFCSFQKKSSARARVLPPPPPLLSASTRAASSAAAAAAALLVVTPASPLTFSAEPRGAEPGGVRTCGGGTGPPTACARLDLKDQRTRFFSLRARSLSSCSACCSAVGGGAGAAPAVAAVAVGIAVAAGPVVGPAGPVGPAGLQEQPVKAGWTGCPDSGNLVETGERNGYRCPVDSFSREPKAKSRGGRSGLMS